MRKVLERATVNTMMNIDQMLVGMFTLCHAAQPSDEGHCMTRRVCMACIGRVPLNIFQHHALDVLTQPIGSADFDLE